MEQEREGRVDEGGWARVEEGGRESEQAGCIDNSRIEARAHFTAKSKTNHCKIDGIQHGMVHNRSPGWKARDRTVNHSADRQG
eukprot:2156828-Rhodomonas_salina.1